MLNQSHLKSQPKIAILMVGNMRSYNNTFSKLNSYLLNYYDYDLYITTYDKRFNTKYAETTNTDEEITEEKVRNVYKSKNLKCLTIVNQATFTEPYKRIPDKIYQHVDGLDRFYTIQKLLMVAYDNFIGETLKNKRQYRLVLKIRPDIMFNDRLVLDDLTSENQIIVPDNDSGGEFNDHLAYGSMTAMEKYFTYYKTFFEVDNSGCDVSIIEKGVKRNLENYGIEIKRKHISYTLLKDIKPQKVIQTGKGMYYVKSFIPTPPIQIVQQKNRPIHNVQQQKVIPPPQPKAPRPPQPQRVPAAVPPYMYVRPK